MKKTRINLLSNSLEYIKIEKQFYYLRLITIVLFFIFIFIFLIVNITLYFDKKQIDNLIIQKKVLLENQKKNIFDETKIKIIFNKYQNFKKFLNNDANFLPYYELLVSSLKTATPEPVLLSFKVDKEKNTEFILGFNNIETMIKFLNFIENENFLNKFENLLLDGFSLDESKMELSFKGKFISIKNENF